ncbi:uncharacterized protein TRIADDRAFT_51797 [Trichoplax adhaerens]|uniref:Uncharacterized protein n=1 Tax=Trichoplax adhaerens TaxID=10228 RepID=B3RKX2_TRIAD|nr:hypothetical protein TRIADDRAFT_51797 [Trichoplax adhaerens]EDV29448.1 hypothetical protein TRIADDRAFT_51797 [Trichoplax adhaerens]|eukprot:XP_002108650.1 hypothetical protein TRIADDRAFT_51797 [Trichoplax adhaerens]
MGVIELTIFKSAPDIPKALLECDDGACISYTDWCDYKNDCHDGSDEKYCGYPEKKICKEVNCCFSSPLFINTDPVVRRCSIYNYIEMCVNITCPAVCKCDSEKIDCSLHELINVPKVDLSIWKIYLLKDNLIKELKPENLKAFFGLRTFDAGSNKIQRIAPDSFNNLTQLSTL